MYHDNLHPGLYVCSAGDLHFMQTTKALSMFLFAQAAQ